MKPEVIFYSWQSDLNPDYNNYFIRDCAKAALKALKKELKIELSLDKDTQKTPGSPDIVETILKKIQMADIFICDVTIINNTLVNKLTKARKTPNPNVLVELGYAIKTLAWERIICVANTNYCYVDDLPFDIRKNRILTYNCKGKADLAKATELLTNTLKQAFRQIIDNYEAILQEAEKNDVLLHDRVLFEKFNAIVSQQSLEESLEFLVNNVRTNRYYYKLWDTVKQFASLHGNRFLNQEIQSSMDVLAALVQETSLYVAGKLHSIATPGQKYESDYKDAGEEITPEIQFDIDYSQAFAYSQEPRDGDWPAFDKRRHEVIIKFGDYDRKIVAAYKDFRTTVKKHLLI
ncbi:hypothetical protein [Mucilaginibacter flavus]|uniref:hypothetical protein n=1 Tax=Mucilaginibacter flavus TaxID=931504 RepID=UPI0025B37108|nr:hypothetical protein [Mucilaginibacter flavus]MDN3582085.1 hypothetical protein [Mucilaginibacter flavus]